MDLIGTCCPYCNVKDRHKINPLFTFLGDTQPVPSVPAGQVGQSMQAAKEAAPHSINATTVRIRHRFVMFRYDYHVWFLVYSLEMVGENPA